MDNFVDPNEKFRKLVESIENMPVSERQRFKQALVARTPSKIGRPSKMPVAWQGLVVAFGGVGKLAEALGVYPATLYHWTKQTKAPNEESVRKVRALSAVMGITSPL